MKATKDNVFPFKRYNSSFLLDLSDCDFLFQNLDNVSLNRINNLYARVLLLDFLYIFTLFPAEAETILSASVFYAMEAYLMQAATANSEEHYTAHDIYTSPRTTFANLSKSLASTIVISLLLGLQWLSFVLLVLYVHSVPTWDTALNALSVTKLVAGMHKEDLGVLREKWIDR